MANESIYIQATRDEEAHAARIMVGEGDISATVPVGEQCLIDLTSDGRVVSIELLGPSSVMAAAKQPSLAIDWVAGTANYNPTPFASAHLEQLEYA